MAYRRKQHAAATESSISASYGEELEDDDNANSLLFFFSSSCSSSTSLVARAIRASSAAHRDSSLSSAYGFKQHSPSSPFSSSPASNVTTTTTTPPVLLLFLIPRQGFWGNLARKAKSFVEDDNAPQQVDSPGRDRHHVPQASIKPKYQNLYPSHDSDRKTDSPILQKGLKAIPSSLNYIGNAVEEGLTKVENRTADIIQETSKHIKKKPSAAAAQNQATSCEKARLTHENSICARENHFLSEVVEYHQLTMQDVVYLDEGTGEVTEVYPIKVASNTHSILTSLPPLLSTKVLLDSSLRASQDIAPHPAPPVMGQEF
ncbi:hypothetical protein GH714_010538 [Hevea brasiliensis]|uniref:Uncharacterized protein n=1 Tax=Hevea brasiliensis TaxID=3981 RepID=A0A6A6KNP0_HEVBR|nr:hypothetical protein GH714_010538 [Hevea brasiliensis]